MLQSKDFTDNATVVKGVQSPPIPSFTWIDDDGVQLAFDRLLPIARELDVPLTFAIITSRFGQEKYISKEAVIELYNEGFDIVDHGYAHDKSHRPTQMTKNELETDLTKTKEIWEAMGIPSNYHVIPFGANTPTTEKIYRKFFDCAIMTSITKNNPEEGVGASNFQPINRLRLERVSYKRSTLGYIKKQIDDAYDNNGWLIIYSHMSVDPYDENKIKEILSYAKEKLDFVSVREGVERFSE
ncbi:MAG: polysaccharide deacetylase family protein [Caldicoprobacterales bacterium]|jgi:peptidoglycan/xylan/chitin deacetylase (PgdA/CDA1 family)